MTRRKCRAKSVVRSKVSCLAASKRLGREGLKRGVKAPSFALPNIDGTEVSLDEFIGRRILLVFTQPGCGPCNSIIPELNRLHKEGKLEVLTIMNGKPEACREWATKGLLSFPALVEEDHKISRQYQIFTSPFAFLISDAGIIISRGLVGTRQYLDFVLSGVPDGASLAQAESDLSDGNGKKTTALDSPQAAGVTAGSN